MLTLTNEIKVKADNDIIVTSLRPMDEAPAETDGILCLCADPQEFVFVYRTGDGGFYVENYMQLNEENFIGWMPMPTYRPE